MNENSYFEDLNTGGNYPLLDGGEPFFIKKGKIGCLLCHGFTGTPHEMKGIGNYLARNDISVLGPLLPGHGTTINEMKKTTAEDYYSEYTKAVQKLQEICDEIFICGLSLGGVLSLKFASENNVTGVISLAAPAKFLKLEGFFLATLGSLFKRMAIKKNKEELKGQKEFNIVCYDFYPIGPAISLRKIILKTRKVLGKIHSPILIIQGKLDVKWIVDSSKIIYNEVGSKTKELVFLERTSHVITVGPEKENVQKKILEFIQKNSG